MRLINFLARGAVDFDVWEIPSVKSNSKASKGNENKSKMAAARPKEVTAVGGKSLTKKKHQTATKATRIPKKTTTASPTRGKPLKPPKIRKEDFIFSVTPEFRKKFKKAAKDAGHKKGEFMQILLASWQERGPSKAEKQA
jgi:hypothetical protein